MTRAEAFQLADDCERAARRMWRGARDDHDCDRTATDWVRWAERMSQAAREVRAFAEEMKDA